MTRLGLMVHFGLITPLVMIVLGIQDIFQRRFGRR
jgi:hypothetical protein